MSEQAGTYESGREALDHLAPVDPFAPQALAIQRETTSSINLQRAKDGTYYYDIKSYFDGSVFTDQERALAQVQQIDHKLRELFIPGGAS